MIRYEQTDDNRINDTFTGEKLTLTQITRLLNIYEEELLATSIELETQKLEGTRKLENGVLWRFINGKWHAGCSYIPLKERD